MTIPPSVAPASAVAAATVGPVERATKLPYDEVDRLLVEGELVRGDDGVERRVWPTQRELAKRYGVAPSLVGGFASERQCASRRKAFQEGMPPQPPEPPKEPAVSPAEGDDARRGPGRPRRGDGPAFPHDRVFDALVYGEIVQHEDGSTTTVYPTYRELADRHGVAVSVIAEYAKSRNALKRRELARARYEARKEEKIIELRSDKTAFNDAQMLQVLDEMFMNYASAVTEGRMRFDNVNDIDKLWRLKSFIQGGPDSRQEIQGAVTLEALQQRYETMLRNTRDVTLEMTGYVPRARIVDGVVVHDVEPVEAGRAEEASDPRTRSTEQASRDSNPGLLTDLKRVVELARSLCISLGADEATDEELPEVRLMRFIAELERSALASNRAGIPDDSEDAEGGSP
jgi:hypothetical protein